jgi:hypothetical protein
MVLLKIIGESRNLDMSLGAEIIFFLGWDFQVYVYYCLCWSIFQILILKIIENALVATTFLF